MAQTCFLLLCTLLDHSAFLYFVRKGILWPTVWLGTIKSFQRNIPTSDMSLCGLNRNTSFTLVVVGKQLNCYMLPFRQLSSSSLFATTFASHLSLFFAGSPQRENLHFCITSVLLLCAIRLSAWSWKRGVVGQILQKGDCSMWKKGVFFNGN